MKTPLTVGKTYYAVTYADVDQTMPGLNPLIYIGQIDTIEDGLLQAFQDTVSFMRYGSRLAPGGADRDDLEVSLFPPDEIGSSIVRLEDAVLLVQASLQRAIALGWPSLPVLPDGWHAAT